MRLRTTCVLAGAILLFPLTAEASAGPDSDGDGFPDNDDNCPQVFNPNQNDGDSDGVGDLCDNCTLEGNAGQEDSDQDGFGNRCDADFNKDCFTSIIDWGIFQQCLTAPGVAVVGDCRAVGTDLNSDNRINALDFQVFEELFGLPPGPAAGGTC